MAQVKFIKKMGDETVSCMRDISQTKSMTENGWTIAGGRQNPTAGIAKVTTPKADAVNQALIDIANAKAEAMGATVDNEEGHANIKDLAEKASQYMQSESEPKSQDTRIDELRESYPDGVTEDTELTVKTTPTPNLDEMKLYELKEYALAMTKIDPSVVQGWKTKAEAKKAIQN